MTNKQIETIVKGVQCCQNEECEGCPYAAAAENCTNELDVDLHWMADSCWKVTVWSREAVKWLKREQPDTLMTMVMAIGSIPEEISGR